MAHLPISKFKRLQAEAQALLEERELEHYDSATAPAWRKTAHFWVMVGRSFVRNRCPVRAAALAYTTLLGLVPLLAVVVGVSTSLLKQEGRAPIDNFIEQLVANLAPGLNIDPEVEAKKNPPAAPPQNGRTMAPDAKATKPIPATAPQSANGVQTAPSTPEADSEEANIDRHIQLEETKEAAQKVIGRLEVANRIKEAVDNIHSGALGVTGILGLVFVAISLLSTIEGTFNDMWGVSQGRSWFARVVQYWAALTLVPLFLVVAVGLTSARQFNEVKVWIEQVEILGKLIFRVLPYVILSLTCSLLYLLMPNTKVGWRAAAVGGFVGGVGLQLNNTFSVLYVSKVVGFNKMYGSLGLLPVFLVGLYFSWIIVLFGAQVAYAFQNRKAYIQEKQAEKVNQRGREFIAFRLMTEVAERFKVGAVPPTSNQLSEKLGIPLRLTCQVLGILLQSKLVCEVAGKETGYVPARPLNQITEEHILRAMRSGQGEEIETAPDAARDMLRSEFEAIQRAEEHVAGGVTMENLVCKMEHHEPNSPV